MKGIVGWGVFALFYLAMMLLFQVTEAQLFSNLFGSSDTNKNGADGQVNGASQQQQSLQQQQLLHQQQQQSSPTGTSNSNSDPAAILRGWGITDPAVIQNVNNIYGSMMGQPECIQKSICVMGNYFHNLPGRDVVFTLLGRYVPQEWGLLYDIFRVSVMYGQDCEAYRCDPERTAALAQQHQQQVQNTGGSMFQSTSTTVSPPAATTTPMSDQTFESNNQILKQQNPARPRW